VDEEPLLGGNTHTGVTRVGDTVRRPAGPWTPGVHAVLRHLEEQGFEGAPRALGLDERGREIVTYVPGRVVHPDHGELLESDDALASVAALIRALHDAMAGFTGANAYTWSARGRDPHGSTELLCHNDLAPWNLVALGGGGWAFIDWDSAAPGRRSWELGWALVGMIPLFPDAGLDDQDATRRLAVFADGYGRDALPRDTVALALDRCRHEAALIYTAGAAGEAPYAQLLADGHAEAWHAAATHVATHLRQWTSALAG
jgi:hypothetical protein